MRREKITIAFASVIEALFLLLEIYFMIHARGNFPVLLIVAICMVAVLFFLVLSIIELNQKNKENERQEYADIYKAQKASYLAQKKYFDELNERLNQLEENTNFPAEDIITAQKAVAKVTISRSKENADALMNANDELIQRVFGFEEKLADNNDALLRQQETLLQQTREELVANNKGMQDQFHILHQALEQMKQEISDLELRQGQQGQMSSAEQMRMPQEAVQEAPVVEAPTAEEPAIEEPVFDDAPVMDEPMPEEPAVMEEAVMEEPEVQPVEEMPANNNGEISQAEIDAMLASLVSDTDQMRQDEPVIEEEAPMIDEGPVAQEEAEQIAEEAQETEEPRMMGDLPSMDELPPDDDLPSIDELPSVDDLPSIDELDELDLPDLENYEEDTSDLPNLDTIPEPEPIMMDAPVADDKPAMPDLSYPNKVLSPDEIAALFANM